MGFRSSLRSWSSNFIRELDAPAGSPGDLGDHERAAVRQLAQDIPARGAAETGEDGFQRPRRRCRTGGSGMMK